MLLLGALPLALSSAEPSPVSDRMVVHKGAGSYDAVRENLELAITGRGLILSGQLYLSDMLARTGKDLGYEREIFVRAEALEFCSAELLHQVVLVDPTNLTICPFTIAVYVLAQEPHQIYVAYRRATLAGSDTDQLEDAINEMLEAIAREGLE
jgi:hypothetical protein